ncbi:MAG: tripartite tricarboxylate transporter substrate binding protein [Burkholderiaceae bacterium]|nr:tripartite tricarboxylate transporter substrate binding protein [Burkholderiaceae bacterium]
MIFFKSAPSRRSLLMAALLCTAGAAVQAQAFPNKPIRILVGYSPGGGVDAMARLIAPYLATQLGQPVVIENRTGAAGLIAGDAAAKAAPDGYTLLMGESGLLIAQYLQASMSFDPIKSFAPVAGVFKAPLLVVVNNDFPAKTPKEMIALLKANPGKYSFATSGVGTVQHLGFEMLKGQTGSFVVHVPYRGAGQIIPDVVGGQIPIGVISAAAGIAQAKAGKLRAIALMSKGGVPGLENVPPLADALPGFDVAPRLMLLAPAGTPPAVVGRLAEAARVVLANPEVIRAAGVQGAVPAYLPSAALAADLNLESASWGKIVRDQKITAQ